ncbi:MAG: EFR1 family ferrodoxin [Oscillospiraceae bacterium]|nr:EFR1 family ferrodoxin [Oscillospiraceae bacterium]
MVLYYSATGNTEYIAQEIAKRLDDECLNLLDRIKAKDNSLLRSKKPFVICAPIIVCEMPRFLSDYLENQSFLGSREVYFIFTSGGYCGIAGVLAKKLVEKKMMTYCGHAEFRMPRNYVASDAYSQHTQEEIEERILESHSKLDDVAELIKSGQELSARKVQLWETVVTVPFNPVWVKYKLTAKDFYSTDKCIGCGMCERRCPLNNIKLKDKRPVWGNSCTHCMACIGNCPVEAIEYGDITQKKEKYNFSKYRHLVKDLD